MCCWGIAGVKGKGYQSKGEAFSTQVVTLCWKEGSEEEEGSLRKRLRKRKAFLRKRMGV